MVHQSCNPMISHADLMEISQRSQSLSQRLNHKLLQSTKPAVNIAQQAAFDATTKQQNINQRLQRWCQVVADGDWEKFNKRLSWDYLDMEQIQPLLEDDHLTKETQSLSWTNTLITLGETAASFSLKQVSNQILALPIEPEEPLPFEEAFLPGIMVARQKLSDRLTIAALSPDRFPLTILSQAAYRSLERMLLQRLIVLSAKTLYFEFCQFRPSIYEGINLLLEELNLVTELEANSPEKKYYHAFLEQLWQDGFWALWKNYPVLARLIAITLDFWVEATTEFIERFQLDCPEITKRLENCMLQKSAPTKPIVEESPEAQLPNRLGQITSIKGSLSDFHNQGRSVLILTFKSGQKLVYKPQNLGIEIAYNKFLDWCNQQQCPLPFKVLNHYNRGSYGWVLDFVEQEPCPDRASTHCFYQRGGMLLCLLYVLGANDCHYENVIAHGEELVLIDLETMMHPQAQAITDSPQAIQEMLTGTQKLSDSVLRTGLLPRWNFSPDNLVAYDISGLGSVEPQKSPRLLPEWKLINTDEMYQINRHQKLPLKANIPRFNGVTLAPQKYLKDLIEGFTQMYRFLREKRQTLLEAEELLALLASQKVRFIFRATHVYQALLEKTLSPDYLRHGIDRSIELDILSRTFLHAEERPRSWSILAAELTAMEQLDIPYFGTTARSNDLTVGLEQPIAQYLNSSYDRFIERFQALSDRDLAWQIKMIRSSFASRFSTSFPFESTISRSLAEKEIPFGMPAQPSQFLIEARRIAEEIQATSIIDGTGNAHWMGLSYVDNSDRFQLQPLGYNLYDGKSGIALFLSALDWVTGDRKFRHLVLNALNPLRKLLRNSNQDLPQKFVQQMGIGGATGIGSIFYSLVKIAQFLEDETWLEDASLVANFLTPEMIESDRKLDIISGGAGTILGLLSLYQKTREEKLLHQSIACGQSLVSKSISFEEQPRAWKTIAKMPLTGFSHGAAGIAYALLRLYEVTQDQQYLAVAREGIAYETAVFSPTAHNWPDFLTMSPTFKVMWCHGATGIGLARLGGLHIDPKQDIDQDIEIALEATEKYSRSSVDHLCCGHFGRIELLLKAGQVLNRPQLLEIANQKATHLMEHAQKNRGYRLFGNASQGALNPGFFQGIAGIGYQLLRLAYPELLPVVLLWE